MTYLRNAQGSRDLPIGNILEMAQAEMNYDSIIRESFESSLAVKQAALEQLSNRRQMNRSLFRVFAISTRMNRWNVLRLWAFPHSAQAICRGG